MAIRPEDIAKFEEIEFGQFVEKIDAALRANWSSLEPESSVKIELWSGLDFLEYRHREMAERLKNAYRESGWRVEISEGQQPAEPEPTYSPFVRVSTPIDYRGRL